MVLLKSVGTVFGLLLKPKAREVRIDFVSSLSAFLGNEQTWAKWDNWHVKEKFSLSKNKFNIVHSVYCECICIPVVSFIAIQLKMCKWNLGSAKWCPPASRRTFLVWERNFYQVTIPFGPIYLNCRLSLIFWSAQLPPTRKPESHRVTVQMEA